MNTLRPDYMRLRALQKLMPLLCLILGLLSLGIVGYVEAGEPIDTAAKMPLSSTPSNTSP